jgi:hypothetical protein
LAIRALLSVVPAQRLRAAPARESITRTVHARHAQTSLGAFDANERIGYRTPGNILLRLAGPLDAAVDHRNANPRSDRMAAPARAAIVAA